MNETNNIDILKTMTIIRIGKPPFISQKSSTRILMLVLLAMLLIALVLGVTVYKNVATVQIAADEARLGKQVIANVVRSDDGQGSVLIGRGPEGPSLVTLEHFDFGSFETRIYLSNGTIVQEYTSADTPYSPSKGVKLADSSKFDLSYNNGLLTIDTDQGTTCVALRSVQGGA